MIDTNNDTQVAKYLGYGPKSSSTIKYQRVNNPVRYQTIIDGIKVHNARERAETDDNIKLALAILGLEIIG